METESWRKQAFGEYTERRKAMIAEVQEARANVERAQAIAKARENELAEFERAAEIFGIVAPRPSYAEPATMGIATAPDESFKDLALEFLKNSYPKHVRAADVQDYVERRLRKKFHDKTAGMTLFRFSRDGVARRVGWDWFYVPEDQREGLKGEALEQSDDPAQINILTGEKIAMDT
jgi:hypothetical protein